MNAKSVNFFCFKDQLINTQPFNAWHGRYGLPITFAFDHKHWINQIVRRQYDVGRADILLQSVQLPRAWDRHDPRFASRQPRQGDLRARQPAAA